MDEEIKFKLTVYKKNCPCSLTPGRDIHVADPGLFEKGEGADANMARSQNMRTLLSVVGIQLTD